MNVDELNSLLSMEVTAGIIRGGDSILIAQRKYGDHLENKWKFPEGKLEEGETPENCLTREIREELS